jgi:hypothetical protein
MHYSEQEVKGRNIREIFNYLGIHQGDYLDMNTIRKNPECPGDLYVKIIHPISYKYRMTRSIFQFSYAEWFKIKGKKYLPVSIIPQSLNAPVIRQLFSIYRSENQPTVLLDERYRIFSFNLPFVAMLNFPDQNKLMGKPIISLLNKKFKAVNPFIYTEKQEYIRKTVNKNRNPWQIAYQWHSGKRTSASVRKDFFSTQGVAINPDPGSLIFQKMPASRTGYAFLLKPINFSDQDLKIELECSLTKGSILTLALSYPCNKLQNIIVDPAYSVDLEMSDQCTLQFFRRSTPVSDWRSMPVKPDRSFKLVIRRIGPQFIISLGNKSLIKYADPLPILGRHTSHLYFYVWRQCIQINRMKVSTRPTIFNFEEMDRLDSNLLSFESAPNKLFRFSLQPVVTYEKKTHAVRFQPLSMLVQDRKSEQLTELFEEARHYIRDNFFRKIDFKTVARKCCVSYNYFFAKFKEFYKISPRSYQIELYGDCWI